MKQLLSNPYVLFLIGFFLPSPRQLGRLLRDLLVNGVKLVAITTGQTIVRDYIEDHFSKQPHHRADTGVATGA